MSASGVDDGSQSSMKRPMMSLSVRYSSVAALTASGSPSPSVLPGIEAAGDRVEDARQLAAQLGGEVRVALVGWDRDGERDEPEPTPDRFVCAADDGLVVRDEQRLGTWAGTRTIRRA